MIFRFGLVRFITAGFALAATTLLLAAPASAAQCGGSYEGFLAQMQKDALAAGVNQQTINTAFAGLAADQTVLAFDRRQHGMFHSKSFEDYARTRVIPARINRAKKLLAQYADLFSRIEQKYGVPREMIMAIWTMETDNGRVDLRHSVPDVLASTANLLHTNGWVAGQPYHEGTANFEAMHEWNHSETYRKTLVLFAEQLGGRS